MVRRRLLTQLTVVIDLHSQLGQINLMAFSKRPLDFGVRGRFMRVEALICWTPNKPKAAVLLWIVIVGGTNNPGKKTQLMSNSVRELYVVTFTLVYFSAPIEN